MHWEVILYEAKIGETELPISSSEIIFDSGSSLIYIPHLSYNVIIKEISKGKECNVEDSSGLFVCTCNGAEDSSFPTIFMQLGSKQNQYWF